MKELEFTLVPGEKDEYVGEFTFFCDKYVEDTTGFITERKQKAGFCTYVMPADWVTPKCMAIRFPGATRGHIELDEEEKVVKVEFYTDSGIVGPEYNNVGIYEQDIIEATKVFIGRKIKMIQEGTKDE